MASISELVRFLKKGKQNWRVSGSSSWEKEKARLISQGAVSLWYEDIKDLSAKEILILCGYEDAIEFDKDDLYFRGIKLEKVWS